MPWQFWRVTPGEFRLILHGFYRREDRAWHKVGTLGLWVLAPHSKKRHTILGLLNRARLWLWPKWDGPTTEPSEEELEELRDEAERRALEWAKD